MKSEKSLLIILRKKSKFNPKRKDAFIEIFLSHLEEEIFSLDKNLVTRI